MSDRLRIPVTYDVLIVDGGPAGLAAALVLGRARKRVLLCDAGARRNAAAKRVHGFVSRDGVAPDEFRRVSREQLQQYPSVAVRDTPVLSIDGERDAFTVELDGEKVQARRVLLCTGLIDELPDLDGFAALWGTSIFQCPYCHGWEVQDQRFGVLLSNIEMLDFAIFLRGWSNTVVALTDDRFDMADDARARLAAAGVSLDDRRIARLGARDAHLDAVHFTTGEPVTLDVLFARPKQRQVALVAALGLELDGSGFVQANERKQTSKPGIYAAGDLQTQMQSALFAASAGALAGSMINHELTLESVVKRTV